MKVTISISKSIWGKQLRKCLSDAGARMIRTVENTMDGGTSVGLTRRRWLKSRRKALVVSQNSSYYLGAID